MLTQVTDLFGHQFRFHYDTDQRIDSVTRFAERADSVIGEHRGYDADGRLVARKQNLGTLTIQQDALTYNAQNKVAHNTSSGDSAHYNPLGQLVYGAYQPGGHDIFVYDAEGNQDTSVVVGEASSRYSWFYYDQHSNQINHIVHPFTGPYRDTSSSSYAQGRVTVSQEVHPFDNSFSCGGSLTCYTHYVERRRTTSNYGLEGRLRSTYLTLDSIPNPNFQYQRYTYTESYRYDALGRRIWTRILRDANCNLHDAASGCVSAVTRTVWHGDRTLYEIRQSAGPNPGITGSQFGTVGYLNAFSIDEPIELWKGGSGDIVLPYVNWRGNYQVGTCPLALCANDHPAFPSSEQSSYGDFFPTGAPNWYGDVIAGHVDASGLLYRRNRYLDPKTGRFTQEDPIGLAGGTNTYGFARGDPVSFSDPFGLLVQLQWHLVYTEKGINYYHLFIKITPDDQEYWKKKGKKPGSDGKISFTIGAGPAWWKLGVARAAQGNQVPMRSGVDRRSDVNDPVAGSIDLHTPKGQTENAAIENLLAGESAYEKQAADYTLMPQNSSEYNSNSFALGLLKYAGYQIPVQPNVVLPGYGNPMPSGWFIP